MCVCVCACAPADACGALWVSRGVCVCMSACVSVYVCARGSVCVHACARARVCVCVHACMCACLQARVPTIRRACVRVGRGVFVCLSLCACVCMRACMCVRVHACVRACARLRVGVCHSEGRASLQALFEDFVGHNVEMAATLLDTAGRFLFRQRETHTRMSLALEVGTLVIVSLCPCLSPPLSPLSLSLSLCVCLCLSLSLSPLFPRLYLTQHKRLLKFVFEVYTRTSLPFVFQARHNCELEDG